MSSEVLNQKYLYIPRRALLASLILHGTLLSSLVITEVLDKMGVTLFKKPIVKSVYQEFIQVDVVALPDMLVKDMPKLDASEPIVEKPHTSQVEEPIPAESPDAMVHPDALTKAKEEAAQLKERLRREQEKEKEKALKKLKEEAKREAALKALAAKQGQQGRQKIAGNVLSKGTSTTGNIGTSKDQYTALVAAKIKQHFNVFSWQKKKGLVSVVRIDLHKTGRVRNKTILRKSVDTLFDSAVLQAIEDAQPLPIPEDLSLIDEGITIEFRPEE